MAEAKKLLGTQTRTEKMDLDLSAVFMTEHKVSRDIYSQGRIAGPKQVNLFLFFWLTE